MFRGPMWGQKEEKARSHRKPELQNRNDSYCGEVIGQFDEQVTLSTLLNWRASYGMVITKIDQSLDLFGAKWIVNVGKDGREVVMDK